MIEAPDQKDGEISLFALGATLLRNRWRIVRWMVAGAVIAAVSVWTTPRLYTASASFSPQGFDAARSGLAGLAGQFGLAIPTMGTPTLSPEFYTRLLRSRVLLRPIVTDTFTVTELGGRRVAFFDLFKVSTPSPALREERAMKLLENIIKPSVSKLTGVVDVSVVSEWPSVSLAIVTDLLNGLDAYNQRTRQGQAAAERKFIEGRLVLATSDLRSAEDRLENFLRSNKQYTTSPQLVFEHDRLQREVDLRQGVFTSLTQSVEDARIREVRNTPVITIVETPAVQVAPEPRGRLKRVLLGIVISGLLAAMVVLVSDAIGGRKEDQSPEARDFLGALGEVRGEVLSPVRSLRRLAGKRPPTDPLEPPPHADGQHV